MRLCVAFLAWTYLIVRHNIFTVILLHGTVCSLIALHEERQSKQRETYTLIAGSDVEKTEDSDCDKDVN
jgi:hypothetical protein